MKNRVNRIKAILVVLTLIASASLCVSCGGGRGFHDLDGKFEIAKDGDDTIYRLKWDNHTLAVLNTAKADFATVLLALRQGQQAVKFVEKESGEKLPDIVMIETIDAKSTIFKGGAKLHGDKIKLILQDGYFYPTIFAHEFAHALPASKINSYGFFSEGQANYFQSKYTEFYISGITNSFDSVMLDIFYNIFNDDDKYREKMTSLYWDSEYRIFLVQLTIKNKSILPIGTVIEKFSLNYIHTLQSWEVKTAEWWTLHEYVAYSYSFCHYLIEKYGLTTFLSMMKKEPPLPWADDYLDVLMKEFYHKPILTLETEFTNYIVHYDYKNQYLKDPAIRNELEGFYLKITEMIAHPEASTNISKK